MTVLPDVDAALSDHRLFFNRELSWLEFNRRVLDETRDQHLRLYERLKFLCIAAANLDEFFMVRVAGLKRQLLSDVIETGADGIAARQQLSAISEQVHSMSTAMDELWRRDLAPEMAAHAVTLAKPADLTASQRDLLKQHFMNAIFPALTPLAVDPVHPFPHLRNMSINIAVLVRKKEDKRKRRRHSEGALAVVQVPGVLPRLVRAPQELGLTYVLLEDVIVAHVNELFPGYVVDETSVFRVTRNWDLHVDEEESEDLLSTIQDELRRRDRGAAVRLEIDAAVSAKLETSLAQALSLESADIYRLARPLQISDVQKLGDLDNRSELRAEPTIPSTPAMLRDSRPILDVVASRDILLHHPYESFEPIVRLLEEAADDPRVLAIKQTLYRTSGDSPIARALARAAENGKQVAVLVEIKARFDEPNNIAWARHLENSGVHVVYGMLGLKTHCKVLLIVRDEPGGIRRYVHVGTGNYNPTTARMYTDLSLLTARQDIAEDVSALFNMLTGYAETPTWKTLTVAPFGLRQRLLALIDKQSQRALQGKPGRIVAKMNSLVDPDVIRALYEASKAGVDIDLLVRGICCLRPGLSGVSDNIRVTSVVDRYLEHSRVFAFGTGEEAEVFIASADWMPRNLDRRIEVMCPIYDPDLRHRLLHEVLGSGTRDTIKGRRLHSDGTYHPWISLEQGVRSQVFLSERARAAAEVKAPTFRERQADVASAAEPAKVV